MTPLVDGRKAEAAVIRSSSPYVTVTSSHFVFGVDFELAALSNDKNKKFVWAERSVLLTALRASIAEFSDIGRFRIKGFKSIVSFLFFFQVSVEWCEREQ